MKQASKAPTRKVVAGAGGGVALGTPAGQIVAYLVERWAGPVPDEIQAAIVAVVAILVGMAVAYVTPPAQSDQITTQHASRDGGIQ